MMNIDRVVGWLWLCGLVLCLLSGPKGPPGASPAEVQLELPLQTPEERGQSWSFRAGTGNLSDWAYMEARSEGARV